MGTEGASAVGTYLPAPQTTLQGCPAQRRAGKRWRWGRGPGGPGRRRRPRRGCRKGGNASTLYPGFAYRRRRRRLLSCRAGLFDGGCKKGRCAPQLNERVAYSTRCTPSFTKSGTAHTLVVLFLSPLLSVPLNGPASSIRAVFAGATHPAPQRTPMGAGAPIFKEDEGHLYTPVALPPSKSSPCARARPCARRTAPFAHLPGCAMTSPRGRKGR